MNTPPTILVTGCNGQVGAELQRALAPLGSVVAADRRSCDLANPDSIRAYVNHVKPHWVVNAAAYTAVDKAEVEQDTAYAVNAEGVGVLAECCQALGANVIHYSTDYVFAGSGEHFQTEDQPAAPINAYGQSKHQGELNLLAANPRSWVLRTSWVFGAYGNNFLKTMLKLWRQRDSLNIVADQMGAPTSAGLIADVTALMIYRSMYDQAPEAGIYHLAASGVTNWQEYAQFVIARAEKNGLQGRFSAHDVAANTTENYPTPAARPLNSRLNCNKLQDALGIQLPAWQLSVQQVTDLLTKESRFE